MGSAHFLITPFQQVSGFHGDVNISSISRAGGLADKTARASHGAVIRSCDLAFQPPPRWRRSVGGLTVASPARGKGFLQHWTSASTLCSSDSAFRSLVRFIQGDWKTFMVQQEEISNSTCVFFFLKGLCGIMFLDNLPLSAHIKMHLTPSWSHLASQQQPVNTLWSRPAHSSCECVCVCVCVCLEG